MKCNLVILTTEELEAHAFNVGFPLMATPDYEYAIVAGREYRAYFTSEVPC